MFQIKRIRGLENSTQFRVCASEYIGINFPLDYLRRSKIFGLYNSSNQMVGGVLIVMEGNLRSFESLPSLKYLPAEVDRWDVAEINSLWLSPEVRRSSVSVIFWVFVILQLIISGKKYFSYTYSSKKHKLRKLYSRAKPIKLFEGETKLLDGMKEVEVETIEIASRYNIALAPLRSLHIITARIARELYGQVYCYRWMAVILLIL